MALCPIVSCPVMAILPKDGGILYGIPSYLCSGGLHRCSDFHQSLQYSGNGETVRLLVDVMEKEGMTFPLHLGVTEAGDGEDGRIKSALGIGALLSDGLGDTIRVSLSEAPEAEIPVARNWWIMFC